MAKLDRYVLSQLAGPFAIFALILIGVYWIARAVGMFDEVISDGQSIAVFLKFMVLFLPQVVAIVLPVVSFAAAIYVSNRMHSDSEMVVLQSSGVSPMRLLRPFAIFGLLIALLAGTLSNYLVPLSQLELGRTKRDLSQDIAARLIVGGKFLHPSDNVTFFVQKVESDGSLVDIFLYDQRSANRNITYTAHKAILFRSKNDARLVMFDGLIQSFDKKNLLLSKIQFNEFVLDLGPLVADNVNQRRPIQDYSTFAALFPTPAMIKATGVSAAVFRMEAHKRLEQPLQSLVYPMIGMATLMLGSFSRFGVLRQVLGAVFIVIALSTFAIPLREIMLNDANLWWLIYLPDILGLGAVYAMLRASARRGRPGARRRSRGNFDESEGRP